MSKLQNLRSASSLNDLAHLLGYKPSMLAYIVYKIPPEEKYSQFSISKSSGGERVIHAPTPRLKLLQQSLANLLQECLNEIERSNDYKASPSHGFKPKKSTITNAKHHRNKRYVLNFDLRDFFPSINFGRVRGFFIKNNKFLLEEKVATIIAQIACHNSSLPQGSPSSPVISNLIGHILDVRLIQLARKNKCYYTRYADDISLSTNEKVFPPRVAIHDAKGNWTLSPTVEKIVERSGFEINHSKTRLQLDFSRQEVTGLVTNKIINTPCEYRKLARAMVRSLIMQGSFHLPPKKNQENLVPGSIDQLHGILSYIDHVNLVRENGHTLNLHGITLQDHDKKSAFEKDFSNFLFYRYCFAPLKPLIICEGKTDNIYLKCAIKSLGKTYPKLCTIKNDKISYKVDFFKYSRAKGGDSQKGRLLGLRGGSDNLRKFISDYGKRCKEIKAPGKVHPVIILIDNDSGSKKIFSCIKKLCGFKKDIIGSESFYHINNNLYVIAIPDIKGSQNTAIEDYFDKATLSTVLNGKKFNASNEVSGAKTYGKQAFARDVIAKQCDKIDFNSFSVILDRIASAIDDYKSKPKH